MLIGVRGIYADRGEGYIRSGGRDTLIGDYTSHLSSVDAHVLLFVVHIL